LESARQNPGERGQAAIAAHKSNDTAPAEEAWGADLAWKDF
jgi:hypothetical protein